MNGIRKIIAKFAEWLTPEYNFIFEEDFPDSIKENFIYIIGDKKSPWLLAFKCPCGCGQTIQLNLLKEADPCWKYKITNRKKINIFPSIWRTKGCKSHFVVRNSKTEWVGGKNRSIKLLL